MSSTLTATRGTIADADGITAFTASWQWQELEIATVSTATFTGRTKRLDDYLLTVNYAPAPAYPAALRSALHRWIGGDPDYYANTDFAGSESEIVSFSPRFLSALHLNPVLFPEDAVFQCQRNAATNRAVLHCFYSEIPQMPNVTNITGATSATFTPMQAQVGKFLRVCGTFDDDAGNSETRCWTSVAKVNVAATGEPAVNGVPREDSPLTADIGTIEDDNGITDIAPAWQWQQGDTADGSFANIAGATAATFTPMQAHVGKFLRVCGTFDDDAGNSETRCWTSVAAVLQADIRLRLRLFLEGPLR